MSKSKIHNVRFYRPKPKGIFNMAFNSKEEKLAVSRSDSTVEIWNLSYAPFIERTITCNTDNYSIEGLKWYKNRLFSVGLHGFLVEYDLFKLCVKSKLIVTGEAAFCLDICEKTSKIAVGTEQGYLNVFQINDADNEILFEKIFDKQEGRILCLKYHKSGDFIASGSTDTIRVWCTETGHALHKMSTGRSEFKKPTIVWCLEFTTDFTIISGDSRGKLSFWDSKVGSHLETYQSHRADILALCLSNDETSLYASGIDSLITNYVKIQIKDGTLKWVKNIQRKIHDNDVRALALHQQKLYSGGIDGYLACSYHPPKTLLKYPPILQNPCVNIAIKSRFILLRYPKCLEIWRLGEASEISDRNGFNLKTEPKKILLIKKTTRIDTGKDVKEGIICANISQDGKWIIYSTIKGIRLLKFNCDDDKPELMLVEFLEENQVQIPCLCVEFLPNNDFVIAPNNGGLKIFKIKHTNPVLYQNLETANLITDAITFLTVSKNGDYIVAADPQSNICVWLLKNNNYNYYCKLPKYSTSPTALAVHPKLSNLVVTYADCNLIEYDLKHQQLTSFSKSLSVQLPKQWKNRNSMIRNITFDPRAPHIIILHDDSTIIVVNKNKEIPISENKIPKLDFSQLVNGNTDKKVQNHKHAFHYIKKYKHLVHLNWLTGDELVAVEVNPMSFTEQLPPCLLQNTFGRK